jgi:hypothetical protein
MGDDKHMSYNFIDENNVAVDMCDYTEVEEKTILLREPLDKKIDEITKDWDCNKKHMVIENVAFNIWLYQLKILYEIDKYYALGIVEADIEILRNFNLAFPEKEEKDGK